MQLSVNENTNPIRQWKWDTTTSWNECIDYQTKAAAKAKRNDAT